MIKRLIVSLVILGLMGVMGLSGVRSEENIKNIKNFVIMWIQDWMRDHYDIENIKLTQIKEKKEPRNVELLNINILYKLKESEIKHHPVILAFEDFIRKNKSNLSKYQITFLKKEIDLWTDNVKSYILNTQELNLIFMVKKIDDIYRIYVEDSYGNFVLAEKSLKIKSREQIKDEVYRSIPSILSKNLVQIKKSVYNPHLAVNYANSYTSNTTHKQYCPPHYTDYVYQDKNYYNTSYTAYTCTDCANYVSQAVHNGGIPFDSEWHPYTSSWNYCPDLNTYMWIHYCWLTYYRPYAIPGSICMMDFDNNGKANHSVLIVYNDGYILKYSAHTNDRLLYILGNWSFDTWFLIFY